MNAKALAVVVYFVINFKLCQASTAKYYNYCLINVIPETRDQLKYLRSLETQKYMDVLFCEKPYKIGQSVQVVVSPVDLPLFRERAEHFNLDYTVLMTDVQRAFDSQILGMYQSLRTSTFSFEHFNKLEDIVQWLTDLNINSSIPVKHFSIGKTVEGRDISMVNINLDQDTHKDKVIVEGGIHGQEWASVVFVTYLINELARAETTQDKEWKKLARTYDWYLIPVLNPDGYEFAHKHDRLWRKNRNQQSVNLNRNFDESFGKFESITDDPTSENYCGPKPFSELETAALSTFVIPLRKDLKYYFAIHAYGQKIIIPYEDRVQHLDNFGEMESYSRQAVRKIYTQRRVKYATGTMYDTIGARISGTSTSWIKKQMRTKYVYTIQVRDNGTYGFALPNDQLRPMCEDAKLIMVELMTSKMRYVRALYTDAGGLNVPFALLPLLGIVLAVKYFFGE